MPLETGSSRKVISHNVAVEVRAGKPSSQAAAVAGLPTTFIAGQCVEAIYNSASGTPANAPATTWVVY